MTAFDESAVQQRSTLNFFVYIYVYSVKFDFRKTVLNTSE